MSFEGTAAWVFRIHHILEAIEPIRQYTSGMTFEQFCADSRTMQAVLHNFIVIGEATRHIPDSVQELYSAVPWDGMRDMRNVLTHEYDRVDYWVVWDTIQDDLPGLPPLLQHVLDTSA